MILEAFPDPAAIIDRNGTILRVNAAWRDFAECSGSPRQYCEGVGVNYFGACQNDEDGARVIAGLQAILNGETNKFEFEYGCHAPTCERWFRLQAAPADEVRSQLLLVHVDVTQHRQVESQLGNQRDFLQHILSTVETIIVALDQQGCVSMINRFGATLLEREESEILGKFWFSNFLRQPEGMERVFPVFQSAMQGQITGADYFENDILAPSGQWRTIAWHTTYFRDGSGNIIGTLSAGSDISEKRRIEAELHARNAELQRAQTVSKIGSWRFNGLTNESSWSHETYRIFGVDPSTPVNIEFFLSNVPEEDRSYINTQWAAAIQNKSSTYELEHRQIVNGQIMWIHERAELDFAADGTFLMAYGTAWDITERKRTDLALREAWARNEVVREEERLRIARELHDDLGQRLTAIKLHLGRLPLVAKEKDGNFGRLVQDLADQTEDTIRAVRQVVNELRPSLLDSHDLTGAIEYEASELRKSLGIRCIVAIPPDPIEMTEKLKTHVFRIFQETLTNIARHAKASRVEISVKRLATEFVLIVEDNGSGIPHGALSGSTFGLVGMQERVFDLGGSLRFETRPDLEGTRLTLHVPLPKVDLIESAT